MMADTTRFALGWSERSAAQQVGVVVLAVLLVSALLFVGYLVIRTNYQPLFSNLRAQDASTIAAELERLKMDFRLGEGGATILVPESQVHKARLKVMSKELPLKGAVGFELFNHADLGMTEFAQKVNYQRALQGELARTIMSLAEVESARVHLSLPESGLFRRAGAKPRASVAIATTTGQELPADAVRGIQRLVAAAVPELESHEVTIINPRGAPMAADAAGGELVSDRRLELKIELERYYARKLLKQVEGVVGPGNASISVDAMLNFDQIRVSQESVGSASRPTRPVATTRSAELLSPGAEAVSAELTFAADRARGSTPLENGVRRVEQIVSAPGGIKRLTIAVLVSVSLRPAEMDQVRQLIVTTAGLSQERGDAVAFFSREKFSPAEKSPVAVISQVAETETLAVARENTAQRRPTPSMLVAAVVAAILFAIVAIAAVVLMTMRRGTRRLSADERAARLERLRSMLASEGGHAKA